MKFLGIVATGLTLNQISGLHLPKAKPIKSAIKLAEPFNDKLHNKVDEQESHESNQQEKRNWYAGNSAFNNGMGTFFKRNAEEGDHDELTESMMVTPEFLDNYLGEYFDSVAELDQLAKSSSGKHQKRNWYAGNSAFNNGMGTFFKRHDPNFEHNQHEEDGALPKELMAKRNWYAGNSAFNNGMGTFFKKRNWYAGNNAYNNGMNSFFKKRNWYAGNNAYNNGMNSFF